MDHFIFTFQILKTYIHFEDQVAYITLLPFILFDFMLFSYISMFYVNNAEYLVIFAYECGVGYIL